MFNNQKTVEFITVIGEAADRSKYKIKRTFGLEGVRNNPNYVTKRR